MIARPNEIKTVYLKRHKSYNYDSETVTSARTIHCGVVCLTLGCVVLLVWIHLLYCGVFLDQLETGVSRILMVSLL
jgi:hypothetical protein